jgi:hypothetical protein
MCTIDAHMCVYTTAVSSGTVVVRAATASTQVFGRAPCAFVAAALRSCALTRACAWVRGLALLQLRPACVSTAPLLMWSWRMSWLKFCLHACSHLEQAVAASCPLAIHVLPMVPA